MFVLGVIFVAYDCSHLEIKRIFSLAKKFASTLRRSACCGERLWDSVPQSPLQAFEKA